MFDPTKFEQLRDLVDNDLAELGSLVAEYESNSVTLIAQLNDSLKNQRVQDMSRAAHTLKSSSALMGASGLASLCEQLESITRKGQIPADAPERIAAIEQGFAGATTWLKSQ